MDFLISFGFRQGYYTTLVSLNARGIFTAALRPLSDFGIMAVLSSTYTGSGRRWESWSTYSVSLCLSQQT